MGRINAMLKEDIIQGTSGAKNSVLESLQECRKLIESSSEVDEALIEQIRSCTFTSEELRMAINCLEGRNIREGIETR